VDGEGNVFVADHGNSRTVVFSAAGEVVRTFGGHLTAAAVILRLRSLAGAQAHETEVLPASSRITSDAAAITPTRVPTGPTVFPEHLQLPP